MWTHIASFHSIADKWFFYTVLCIMYYRKKNLTVSTAADPSSSSQVSLDVEMTCAVGWFMQFLPPQEEWQRPSGAILRLPERCPLLSNGPSDNGGTAVGLTLMKTASQQQSNKLKFGGSSTGTDDAADAATTLSMCEVMRRQQHSYR